MLGTTVTAPLPWTVIIRERTMTTRFGLRFEIVSYLLLLIGAALLFSGGLLLHLAERELLAAEIAGVQRTLGVLVGAANGAETPERLGGWLAAGGIDAWRLVERDGQPLVATATAPPLDPHELAAARLTGAPQHTVSYRPGWLPGADPPSRLLVTLPLGNQGEGRYLQASLSLEKVRQGVARARNLFLAYLAFYTVLLVLCGGYLLDRAVIRPIRTLRGATRQVADGDLDRPLPTEGPTEIADLADSFNAMLDALKTSRGETEASIDSLRRSNDELRAARGELLRAEKLAAVGRLAAGMAHEVGNPLAAAGGYLDYLRPTLGAREGEILDRARRELERIDRLVRDLLDYAAPPATGDEGCDPLAVLREALELLDHQGKFVSLQVVAELPAALPRVAVARHRLLQVAINLLLNAGDAVSEGGTITVAAGCDGQQVWLTVGDDGCGIPADQLAQLFDPFFTTKAPGRGRGLGLAVCHYIVHEAGGEITAASSPNGGTVMRVEVPCLEEEAG